MLVLTRKIEEGFTISTTRKGGDNFSVITGDIHIKILSVERGRVKIGIDAHDDILIHRDNVKDRTKKPNK